MACDLVIPYDEHIGDQPPPRVTASTDVWAFAMTIIKIHLYLLNDDSVSELLYSQILTGRLPFFEIQRDIAVIPHILSGGRPLH